MQPFFKSMKEIQEEEARNQRGAQREGADAIDAELYANILNMGSRLSGPLLVHKIISESEYDEDPNNSRFEIIKNWYSKSIDERSTIISFIKHSGRHFHGESEFRLNDIA